MITLSELIKELSRLEYFGYGDLKVVGRSGSSGTCYNIGSANLNNIVDEYGPFDLKDGDEYIELYLGN